MPDEIDNRIESYLDRKLGRWTRLLFWREELSSHLRELYDNQAGENENPETVWEDTLKDFGDVDHVSQQLWQLHKPKRVFVRLLALLAAIAVLYCIYYPDMGALLHPYSASFLALPTIIIVPFIFFSNRITLKDINFYARLSAQAACLVGAVIVTISLSDPSSVGMGMALAMLSTIYATVFLDVGKWSLCFFVVINVYIVIIVGCLCVPVDWTTPDITIQSIFERTRLIQLAAISLSGLMFGWSRWGPERLPQFLPRIAVLTALLYTILQLMNLTDEYWNGFCLGLLPIIVLPLLQKLLLLDLRRRS